MMFGNTGTVFPCAKVCEHSRTVHQSSRELLTLRKTIIKDCVIEFDKEKTLVHDLRHKDSCSSTTCNVCAKKLLKTGVKRAITIDCRHKDKTKKRKHREMESSVTAVAVNVTDSVFLGGMLNQNNDGNTVTQ